MVDTITIALQGEACTATIEPDAYLRVKLYYEGGHVVLQGKKYEDEPRFPQLAMSTFKVKRGGRLQVDAYSGDGEGTYLHNTYEMEENGLVLKRGWPSNEVEVSIQREQP